MCGHPAPSLQRHQSSRTGLCAGALLLAALVAGCSQTQNGSDRKVLDAWSQTSPAKPAAPDRTRADTLTPVTRAPQLISESAAPDKAIAYVDGRSIDREKVVGLLLAGHGVGVLEQVVVLEKAKMLAAEQGITVSDRDIDAEFERSLRNLTTPLRAADDSAFDREEAERVLEEVLARRNVSKAECMAMVERNAYLRAICRKNMNFTDEQLVSEYQRAYGPRVQVRHIQLASLTEAERVLSQFRAGEDFARLAQAYSANLMTAPAGGLLRPFSRDDPDVPAALAETAFKLDLGEVSSPVRIDEWYHLVRLERKIPAEDRPITEVKSELEARLRERLTEPAMQTLYRSLFEQADIRVVDPTLAAEFARKHPNHR